MYRLYRVHRLFITRIESLWFKIANLSNRSIEGKLLFSSGIYFSLLFSSLGNVRLSLLVYDSRQRKSYEDAALMYSKGARVLQSPDTMFMLGPLRPYYEEYDVIVKFRSDKESTVHVSATAVCDSVISKGYTCIVVTSWLEPGIVALETSRGLLPFLDSVFALAKNILSLGRVIVTDRLQVTLLGYLLGN